MIASRQHAGTAAHLATSRAAPAEVEPARASRERMAENRFADRTAFERRGSIGLGLTAPVAALAFADGAVRAPFPTMLTESAVDRDVALDLRFESLLATHRDRAVRIAWRLVGGDQAAAEDVAQDAFISAYRSLARFRGEAKLETWFYRILVRKAYSYVRWRKVRERFGRVDPEEAALPSAETETDPALRKRISAALNSLPRTQRDAFVLVHMEGFTVREAAEVMGKAEGTVKSHLHRALKKLREMLADVFEGTGATNHD